MNQSRIYKIFERELWFEFWPTYFIKYLSKKHSGVLDKLLPKLSRFNWALQALMGYAQLPVTASKNIETFQYYQFFGHPFFQESPQYIQITAAASTVVTYQSVCTCTRWLIDSLLDLHMEWEDIHVYRLNKLNKSVSWVFHWVGKKKNTDCQSLTHWSLGPNIYLTSAFLIEIPATYNWKISFEILNHQMKK